MGADRAAQPGQERYLLARLAILWQTEITMSISDGQKKRGRPATGQTPKAALRLPSDIRDGLKRWIDAQPDPKPNRSDAIRHILSDWLQERGYLSQDHGLRPDQLTSENDG
jgi:hypothetical protein